jgi:hypothetical protein
VTVAYDTAGDVVNDAASEIGLVPVSDPFSSADPAFVQLCRLLTTAGRELLGLHQWQKFIRQYDFNTTTDPVTPGGNTFELPDDFLYMFDQTYWTPTSRFPLGGPLSVQDWAYLVNTNLASSTIYVTFRLADGLMELLPNPPPADTDINFQYMMRYWIADTATPTVPTKSRVISSDDVILFEPSLIEKFLKLRFLEAKGFDTTAALGQFNSVFMQYTGKDVSMPILSLARNRLFPYLGIRNIPETNYGLP